MINFPQGQQALINLRAAKLRSFLAILGILVGTAAVVALLSCGQLATAKALEEFKMLGTNLLALNLYEKEQARSINSDTISIATWRQLPLQVPQIQQIAPYGSVYQPAGFRGHPLQASVIGTDECLADILKITMQEGRFVSFLDSFEHYCVIGWGVAKQLEQITRDELIGKQIQINHSLYTIIGIAKPWQQSSFFNEDINQDIIIPISGLVALAKKTKINNAILLLKPNQSIDETVNALHQWVSAQAPALSVFARSAKQVMATMENQGRIFTLLLAVIGSISLLVGGIGVMNIMLVSVTERKKEIGIRKALGARNKDIQTLFLTESVLLSLLGGSLGILLGLGVTRFVSFISGWSFTIYPLPLIVGFSVSVFTGIFFGFYPARRAAKLEPMESLRSD